MCAVPGDVLPTAAMTTSNPDEPPLPPSTSHVGSATVDVAMVDVLDPQRQPPAADDVGTAARPRSHTDLAVDCHGAGRS